MAATGTPTPNIGLRIPLGTDPASVDDINYNSNLIDTKLGAVGNDSVQDQIDDLNSKINILSANTDAISDCNSISATGIYKAVNSTLNTPIANNHYVIYHVQYSQSEAYQMAIAVGVRLFVRTYQGTWSSWSEK